MGAVPRLERAEIVLPARGRFDLRTTVLSHRYRELPPFRWHDGARPFLERPEQLPDGSVHLLCIRPAQQGVLLEVTGRDAREIEVLAPLAARVRRALGLDQPVAGARHAHGRGPLLPPGPGRLLRGTMLFEDMIKVLVSRHTSWPEAVRAVTRLTALGRRCPAQPGLRAFPEPAALARLSIRQLEARTGLGRRAARVAALARDVAAGRRDPDAIEHLPLAAATRALRAVPGLGTIGVCWLLLLLGHREAAVIEGAAGPLAGASVALRRGRASRRRPRRAART
jgi:hypothetical protein